MGNLQTCLVSFVESSGVNHEDEVAAESLFEAAAFGIKAISQEWAEEPGLVTPISVEVKAPTVRHQLTLKAVRDWAVRASRSPKERLIKERVRTLLMPS